MWVAENYTYAERSQRFDLTMRDRVLILADQTGMVERIHGRSLLIMFKC